MDNDKLVLISKDELSKCDNNSLNVKQLNFLLSETPKHHQYKRPAKGGGEWSYVTGVYVKKVLNLMFGWNWDFQIKQFEYNMEAKQAIVLGTLTVRTEGQTIIKEQFGRADLKFRKDGKALDLGNDLKAATTDALKKCASELGVASDVYAPNEFKAIQVKDEPADDTAGVQQITYAEALLRTTNYDDERKFEFECELEHGVTTINRCQELITDFQMNQMDKMEGNYSAKDIQNELDKK